MRQWFPPFCASGHLSVLLLLIPFSVWFISVCLFFRLLVIVVQGLSHVQLFVTPCTAACQASLSFTLSWSLLKLMSIELMMSSNHLILCHPLLILHSIFPSIRVFSSGSVLHTRWPSIGDSASILLMKIQGWFPLWLTGFLSLWSKGL